MSAEDRKGILNEAAQYVSKDRNDAYGEPENNFGCIAGFWNAHLRGRDLNAHPIDATDVALMMAGMKLARLSGNPSHRDSWVDIAGYAACGWDTAKPPPPMSNAFTDAVTRINEHMDEVVLGSTTRSPSSQLLETIDKVNELVAEVEFKYGRAWTSSYRCDYQDCPGTPHAYGNGGQWCDGWLPRALQKTTEVTE